MDLNNHYMKFNFLKSFYYLVLLSFNYLKIMNLSYLLIIPLSIFLLNIILIKKNFLQSLTGDKHQLLIEKKYSFIREE